MVIARLAQSVERLTLNQVVVGSSPTVGDYTFILFIYIFIFILIMSSYRTLNLRTDNKEQRSLELRVSARLKGKA